MPNRDGTGPWKRGKGQGNGWRHGDGIGRGKGRGLGPCNDTKTDSKKKK